MAVEEPEYRVTLSEGDIEVREYPPLVTAQVETTGDRSAAGNAGFRLLAAYIFGGNRSRRTIAMTAPVSTAPAPGEQIPMTAPVLQTRQPNGWIVSFVMPAGSTTDTLPAPNDPRVRLTQVAAARVATVRFAGLARDEDVQDRTRELQAFLGAHRLAATGPASLARYNAPWTPWFMRRNEVMIPLAVVTSP